MSTGQIFTREDFKPEGASDSEVDLDVLGKINEFVKNIDKLATTLVDIKEKHPEIMGKFGQLTGGRNMNTPFQGQFSPAKQPSDNKMPGNQISAEKLYTILLGMLHTLEGKGLTIEQAKELAIKNKKVVVANLEKVLKEL